MVKKMLSLVFGLLICSSALADIGVGVDQSPDKNMHGHRYSNHNHGAKKGLKHSRDNSREKVQCINDNFGRKHCGYHCVKTPFKVVCSARPGQNCVANVFNKVRCGYACFVDQFNRIQCKD